MLAASLFGTCPLCRGVEGEIWVQGYVRDSVTLNPITNACPVVMVGDLGCDCCGVDGSGWYSFGRFCWGAGCDVESWTIDVRVTAPNYAWQHVVIENTGPGIYTRDFLLTPVDGTPVVKAGPDVSAIAAFLPWSIYLEGVAYDPDLYLPGYKPQWSKVSGPGSVVFDDPQRPETSATFDAYGAYELKLEYDDKVSAVSDTVMVTILEQGPPVPDVVGMSQTDAEQVLRAQGFVVWITNAPSATVPTEYVISQDPVAGTAAAVGAAVTLTISTGPGGGPGPTPGPGLPTPVAHWALDETSGMSAADSAGNHDGLLRGGPIWLPAGGVIDGALRFDGIDDYVDCGTFNPSAATGKLTVCLWARWDGLNDWYQGLIGKRDAWDAGQMMWQLEAALDTGTVGFFRAGSGPRDGFVLPLGEWMHVAATCDGATAKLYHDGQQVTSGPMTFGSDTAARVAFGACQGNGENPFKGALDDVRLYDQVLGEDQIQAVMGGAGAINWIRAVYWDTRYPSSWVHGPSVRDALATAGYEVLDADQLGRWMDDRIADGAPSVVVFCQDIVPDTVYEAASPTCTLRQYLNVGGKIVWFGDIPLYYQGHKNGMRTTFGVDGSVAALGFPAAGGTWDGGEQVTLTDEGRAWGLTQTWPSTRPAQGAGLRVLARDSAGQAAAWVKHFLPADTYAGLVRFSDCGAMPSAEDVRRLAEYPNSPAAGPAQTDLVAYYEFEGNANDSAGGHHGTQVGDPIYVLGMTGQAIDLDGVGDYVDCGNPPAFNMTKQISVSAWVNIRDVSTQWASIVSKGRSAWRLCTWFDELRIHFAVTDSHYVNAETVLHPNQWYHVCGTYDGASIRIYIDGVEAGREPYSGDIGTSSDSVWIGDYSGSPGREWDGQIDEVRIYDRALSQTEIVDLVALTD